MAPNEERNDTQPLYIDRFIILHLGLLPGGLDNGRGFDEASSINELSEYILYYFDKRSNKQSDDGQLGRECGYNLEDAVKFAGICQALYSLPSSLRRQFTENNIDKGSNEGQKDFAKEVHLSTCTLVFIPLETSLTGGLFAVAQYTKKRFHSNNNISVNPEIIREYICMSHDLFEIIKCGVHNCLMSFDWSIVPTLKVNEIFHGISHVHNNSQTYPGMEELYQKHILLRKLTESSYATVSQDHLNNIQHTKKTIEKISSYLPITFIRKDLKDFYDWTLTEWNSSSSYIDQIKLHILPPIQIKQHENESDECQRSICTLKSIIVDDSFPNMIGFSIFQNECHILTQMKSNFSMSSAQARLIHRYLSTGSTGSEIQQNLKSKQFGYYMLPQSKQKLLRFGEEIIIPNLGRIWLPRIFIDDKTFTVTAMYKTSEIDVVIYLNCPEINSQIVYESPTIQSLIQIPMWIEKGTKDLNVSLNDVSNDISILQKHAHHGLQIMYINKKDGLCIYLNDKNPLQKLGSKKNPFVFPFFNTHHSYSTNIELPKELLFLIEKQKDECELCYHLKEKKIWLFAMKENDTPLELYIALNDEVFKSFQEVFEKIDEICKSFGIIRTYIHDMVIGS